MAIKPEVLDALVAAGCTAEQIAAAVKADQARSSGAGRQARYRARKASQRDESDERDVTRVTVTGGDAAPSPQAKVPPHPPKTQPLSEDPLSPPSGAPSPTPKAGRAARLAADWRPDPATWAHLRNELNCSDAELERELAKAIDWSASAKNGAKTNHDAFFRNWCRSAAEDGKLGRAPPGRQSNILDIDPVTGSLLDARQPSRQDRAYPGDRPRRPGAHDGLLAAVDVAFGSGSQR